MINKNKIPKKFHNDIESFISIAKKTVESNLLSVILFGSVAKGKVSKGSDIDFLVVVNKYSDKKCKKYWKEIKNKSYLVLQKKPDIVFIEKRGLDDITAPFSLDIHHKGITVYGENFVDEEIFSRYDIKPFVSRGKQIGWRIPA